MRQVRYLRCLMSALQLWIGPLLICDRRARPSSRLDTVHRHLQCLLSLLELQSLLLTSTRFPVLVAVMALHPIRITLFLRERLQDTL